MDNTLYVIGNFAQFLGSCTLVYSYFPQLIKLIKSKDSTGMNIQFWTILTIGLACIGINLTIANVNLFIQFTQWFNVILALITLILVIKFKPQKTNA